MAPVVVWTVIALVTALVVILVAGSAEGRSGGRSQFLTHIRGGLRERKIGPRTIVAETRRELAEAADVETSSVEEIFVIGSEPEVGYVDPSEITETLSRATHKAVRGVSQLTRR